MGRLEQITGPRDLRGLDAAELDQLAVEVRDRLVRTCSPRGGHLGPNLGVVELTIALHRVFDSPTDRIVFDTGHQSYVHKMLTGRADRFDSLRTEGGLSGYPSQAESEHDVVENSHASTALSYADGLAKAYELRGEQRHVVAVIGDGALTGGMAWEALNNIAAPQGRRRPLVIVVNDNGRSYTPTVGGLAEHLTSLRTDPRYEPMLDLVKRSLGNVPGLGTRAYDVLHAIKRGMKDALAPQGLFEDLGLKYIGPVDGHDRAALEHALTLAKRFGGPVIVHALTRKGFGYDAAERHEADQFHSPGPFDVETGKEAVRSLIWTDVFADEMVAIGAERPDVVGITAAMLHPVGLNLFAQRHPDRVFDVGIAEQHAATSAAGLAMGGLHPVVAVYATFLNRAFDQVLLDVALHKCGVTFVLDRAGVTGDDGPSHNGMWDMSVLQVVPGLRLAAPRDGARLRELLREAIDVDDAPTVVRFPKGPPPSRHRGRRPGRRPRRARPQGHGRRPGGRGRGDGRDRGRGRRAAGGPGDRRHRGGPPVGQAGLPAPGRPRRPAPAGGQHRGQRDRRRLRREPAAGAGRGGGDHPGAAARHPAGVPGPRQAGRDPGAHRPDTAGGGPQRRGDDDGPGPPTGGHRGRARAGAPAMSSSPLVHVVDEVPELDGARGSGAGPVLVLSLQGFLDAGNAAATAVGHLHEQSAGRVVATFDTDSLHDYRARRPGDHLPRGPLRGLPGAAAGGAADARRRRVCRTS